MDPSNPFLFGSPTRYAFIISPFNILTLDPLLEQVRPLAHPAAAVALQAANKQGSVDCLIHSSLFTVNSLKTHGVRATAAHLLLFQPIVRAHAVKSQTPKC